jgi:hypothetical protein
MAIKKMQLIIRVKYFRFFILVRSLLLTVL